MKFGQLTRAKHRLIADEIWRRNFRIAADFEAFVGIVLARLLRMQIEHELGDGAFEPGELALQHHEARAGHARGGFEIHLAERLAEIEMLLRLEIETRLLAPAANFLVGVFIAPTGTSSAGIFGKPGKKIVERRLQPAFLFLALLNRLLQSRHFGHQRARLRLVLLRLGRADQLGGLVPPRLCDLQPRQQRAQLRVALQNFPRYFGFCGLNLALFQPLVEEPGSSRISLMSCMETIPRLRPFWHATAPTRKDKV